jgi:hypothetical protein
MSFDLGRIRDELRAAPPGSPYAPELAVAVVSDVFRMAGIVPPAPPRWRAWLGAKQLPRLGEQVALLAHVLATTSLRAETVRALSAGGARALSEAEAALQRFFEGVAPLSAEMVAGNAYRQEEFLRNWIAAVGGAVEGEKPRDSAARLEQLDYRKTLAEYGKAEKARQAEAERRARLMKEAAEKQAAAQGWRE